MDQSLVPYVVNSPPNETGSFEKPILNITKPDIVFPEISSKVQIPVIAMAVGMNTTELFVLSVAVFVTVVVGIFVLWSLYKYRDRIVRAGRILFGMECDEPQIQLDQQQQPPNQDQQQPNQDQQQQQQPNQEQHQPAEPLLRMARR